MARKPRVVDIPSIGALDRSSGRLGRQLAHALREAVRKGDLLPSDPLPSSRVLAQSLDIARGTVIEAFEQLLAEGVLETQHRVGTRVANSLAAPSQGESSRERRAAVAQPLSPSARVVALAQVAPAGYGEPQGVRVLREAVADYVRRSRSVRCSPDQVVITSGIQQALYLCCQILFEDGDGVWVEDPAYRG
ncbi:DNA-binding transcriptional MocR family regulator [Parapusillimonas granuli]|uniref:Aminotransferase class I/II-fold pyridoxal phosphate-dependent enzyme n=1 Tax=Parapusillimonas granuli TaxID=380911 RepID=A0A853G151_9BURK|nr:aminotransferase class I/II-fold pyridoxal phosphate-dependent enzyme [Parapusillimonas granuli]MBB5215296.1 DNA-binding transcriptional MocR family regulator [Parapusillimonas granuli]NYT49612.1 aminotransferase class I/II-fold pyridoxal phosphate-dependent enzyme [Parapusillimonas granuli]